MEWRSWGTLRWSGDDVEGPVDGAPISRQEEAEGLDVEEVASAVVYRDEQVRTDGQHLAG